MTINKTKVLLSEASEEMGIDLDDNAISLLLEYSRELIFWNEKMSLVSLKSDIDMAKHLIDSLTPVSLIPDSNLKLLDIGTGAGLPGIPLKIAIRSLSVTLLDSSRRKTSFIKNIVRKLGLMNVSVINSRIESLVPDNICKGYFDIVISRAAFKLPEFLIWGNYFLSEGGTLIAMKGDHVDAELKEASTNMQSTGLSLISCHQTILPKTRESRSLLCFRRSL